MKAVKSHYIWGQWGTLSFESPLKTSRRGLIAALVQTGGKKKASFLSLPRGLVCCWQRLHSFWSSVLTIANKQGSVSVKQNKANSVHFIQRFGWCCFKGALFSGLESFEPLWGEVLFFFLSPLNTKIKFVETWVDSFVFAPHAGGMAPQDGNESRSAGSGWNISTVIGWIAGGILYRYLWTPWEDKS